MQRKANKNFQIAKMYMQKKSRKYYFEKQIKKANAKTKDEKSMGV